MITRTKYNKTVKIVEERLAASNSENPMRDLMFLSEHYKARGELDKAHAASRQMLRVAEGDTSTRFEVTPLDVDLLLDKDRYAKSNRRNYWRSMICVLAVECLVAGGIWVHERLGSEEMTDVQLLVAPWDSNALNNKARFELRRQDWQSASVHLNRALWLDLNNKESYRLEAEMALARDDSETALRYINRADLRNFSVVLLKAQILSRQGQHRLAAQLPLEAIANGIGHPDSWVAERSAHSFATAGDYDAALAAAQKQESWATNPYARRSALTTQADILLKLGRCEEAINAATRALNDTTTPARPLNSRAYLYRAESKLALNDLDGALEDITHSMATERFSVRQFEVRIAILSALGRMDEANNMVREENEFVQADDL